MTRRAACRCGQLTAVIEGEPVRVSVCHCHACQRRTGGPFSAQARFAETGVTLSGDWQVWERVADSGRRASYRWCPACGATVAYTNEDAAGVIAIPLGAFDPGDVPAPKVSVFEERKQPWVTITGTEHER